MALSGASDYITERYPKIKRIVKWGRRILGVKEAPKPKEELVKKYFYMQPDQTHKAVAVIPIGTKKDRFNIDGLEEI